MKEQIFLDHSATTPVDPEVIEAMLPYWTTAYGNPASSHHFGRAANLGLETARRQLAELLGVKHTEIIFTGCGSEADNLAIKGSMLAARSEKRGNHLIISAVEHEAVTQSAEQLVEQFQFELTIIGVDSTGLVNPADIKAAIRPDTALISVMAANNEIGTVQPIDEIGQIARDHDILFHTDAVQAAPFYDWDLSSKPIDLWCMAPHKFYGPKGVGVMYIREGVSLTPHLSGGSQESGRRAGTVNVPFAVGAAKAFELAMSNRTERLAGLIALRDKLIDGLLTRFPQDRIRLTGHPTQRLPHHTSFALSGITGNEILMHLDLIGIAGSSGSACSSGNPEPSKILEAIGLTDEWTSGGLRLTLGHHNSEAEIETVLDKLPGALDAASQFHLAYQT